MRVRLSSVLLHLLSRVDVKIIQEFQSNVAIIQEEAMSWFHTVVPHMFPVSLSNYPQR